MNHTHDALPETAERIVYVRKMNADELPAGAPADTLYAIHDASGQRIGMAPNRDLAFAAARQHEFSPVSAH